MMENSWAVVTGGSDGIGLEICKKLAREGFNICIVSRNQSKIEDKLKEITLDCRKDDQTFKTLCIVADFGKMFTIDEYHKTIGDKIANLDVAILVLNAGIGLNGAFYEFNDSHIQALMQINANQVCYLSKVVLPQLVKRFEEKKVKSAVLMTSSIAAEIPLSGMTIYSATKVFVNFLADGLFIEHRNKIDIMSYTAGFVITKLTADWKREVDYETITAKRAAEICFRDLGQEPKTAGDIKHEIAAWGLANASKQQLQKLVQEQKQREKLEGKGNVM